MAQEKEAKTGAGTRPTFGKNPPFSPFKDVIAYLDKLVSTGGTHGTFDDLTKAVDSSSISSSTFVNRSAVLKNFGLIRLDRKTQWYSVETPGVMIAAGAGDEQRKEAIKKAFLTNATIRKIWDTYKGGIMPSRESFPHNLHSKLPDLIPKELQGGWAKYFYDGAEFAKLIEKRNNGHYLNSGEPKPESATNPDEGGREENNGGGSAKKKDAFEQPDTDLPTDVMPLSKTLSTGRTLVLAIPEEPTVAEAAEMLPRLNMVIALLQGILNK